MQQYREAIRAEVARKILQCDLRAISQMISASHLNLSEIQNESECKAMRNTHVAQLLTLKRYSELLLRQERLDAYRLLPNGEKYCDSVVKFDAALKHGIAMLRKTPDASAESRFGKVCDKVIEMLNGPWEKLDSSFCDMAEDICTSKNS